METTGGEMVEIELEPDLSSCVQTLAKREYDRLMRQLLTSDEEDAELQERLETLRMFLESTDFSELRSRYEPYLVQGKRVRFTLRQAAGKAECQMEIRGSPR
jgi:hypothetical protein